MLLYTSTIFYAIVSLCYFQDKEATHKVMRFLTEYMKYMNDQGLPCECIVL